MSFFQRRSSKARPGGRFSQDRAAGGNRFVDERRSQIPLPRGSTQVSNKQDLPSTFKRNKSTLGTAFTPQEAYPSGSKITPQATSFTPRCFGSYSSKKAGHQKDLRNLQDKEFQKEALFMVTSYFRTVPSVKITDIRQMTLKMFVEMVNHLLAQLGIHNKDELVQFTTANYVKELPHWIGSLEYPGSITKGWLQTVNVPQCFPQVLGLLSWLVSIVQVTLLYDVEEQLNDGIDHNQEKRLQVAYLNACLTAHNRLTAGEEPEDAYQDICEELIDFSKQLNGVTDEALAQLEKENEKLQETADDQELKEVQDMLDELEQRLNVAQSQSMKALDDLEKIKESIEQIKINSSKRERNIVDLELDIKNCRQELEILKRQVETQSMSVNEFSAIKKKCDFLLQEISYMEKECEDNEKLVSRYEHDIATKRDKILQNASMFNRQVIQLEQQIPGLQGLRARTNPESTDVVEDVEKLVRALRDLKSRLAAEFEELEALRREKQQRVDSFKQRLKDAASSEVTVRERVLSKKTEIEQLRSEVAEKEKTFKSEVKELENRQMVFQQKQQECDNQMQEVEELQKKSDLYDRCKLKLVEMDAIQWKKIEERALGMKLQLCSLKNKIKHNQADIEQKIDQLVAELHQS